MRASRAQGIALLLAVSVSACSGGGSASDVARASTSPSTRTTPSATVSAAGTSSATPDTGQKSRSPALRTNPSSGSLDLRPTVGSAPVPSAAMGYVYVAPSRSALVAAAAASHQYSQISTGRVVRGLSKSGRRIGDVVAFGLDKKYVQNPTFQGQVVNSLVTQLAGRNAKTSFETIGETGIEVATTSSSVAVAWFSSDSVIVVVCGSGRLEDARAFISAYPLEH